MSPSERVNAAKNGQPVDTLSPDWTAWEPDRDIDSCCHWAEVSLFAAVVRDPECWATFQGVESDWFDEWKDRVLWDAIRFAMTANDGVFEPTHVREWLNEQEPQDAKDLFAALADYGDLAFERDLLPQAVAVLRRAGERRMLVRWAQEVIELCRSAAPINVIRELVRQAPLMEGGAA